MQNFTYVCPTKIVFGLDAVSEIAKQNLLPAGARVMITYGGGSVIKNGVLDKY